MEKALIAACTFRTCLLWQFTVKFHCHNCGIFHLILGISRMNAFSGYMNHCLRRIEVLIFQLAERPAVNSIGIVCTEPPHIKMVHAAAHFFIGGKCNGNIPVYNLRMAAQLFCHRHNLCHTGFIVCAKQCCTVCRNQRLSGILHKLRKFFHR